MEGNRGYLRDRREKFLEGLKKSKNAEFLEQYPVPVVPGSSDTRLRKRKVKVVKKISYESKI
jgi:hypothetical protein